MTLSEDFSAAPTSDATRRDRKAEAVQRHRDGESVKSIALREGVHISTAYRWIQQYGTRLENGAPGSIPVSGRPFKLTKEHREQLYAAILHDELPWSIPRVIRYANSELDIVISRTTAWRILKQINLVPEHARLVYAQRVLQHPDVQGLLKGNKRQPLFVEIQRIPSRKASKDEAVGQNTYVSYLVTRIGPKQQYQFNLSRGRASQSPALKSFNHEEQVIVFSYGSLPFLRDLPADVRRLFVRNSVVAAGDPLGQVDIIKLSEHPELSANT